MDEVMQLIEQAGREEWTELNLSGQELKELPPEIGQLQSLTTLYLGNNQLSQLPPEIGQLQSLTTLYLGNNQFSQLPPEIGQLQSLMGLFLHNNQLSQLPPNFGQLQSLAQLRLGGNQLSQLPPEIGKLQSLTKLSLENNRLTRLSPEIGKLQSLTQLKLENNRLLQLPPEIGQLQSLTGLFLYENDLLQLPPEIGQLQSLTGLFLHENDLSQLPPEIGQLQSLTILYLGNNQLSQLPFEIEQLQSLMGLYLHNNPFTELPQVVFQLQNLQKISLDIRFLEKFLKKIDSFSELNTIFFCENDKEIGVPPEIVGQGEKAIRFFVKLIRSQQKTKVLNEAKMLLVGQGAVGKTSLVNRIIRDEFCENETMTDGIKIDDYGINIKEDRYGKEETRNVKINAWDFGGQEILYPTHEFFLTERSLYILVWDARQEDKYGKIEHWLELSNSFGGDSPILLVINKIDDGNHDIDRKYLQDKYHNIKGIVRVSCKTREGIEELKKLINEEIGKLNHVKTPWPESWFEVKTDLEEHNSDYITFEEYKAICRKHEVGEGEDQEYLVRFLHDLGIVLNFRDDPTVSDMNVLNPTWVTNGVYRIVTNEKLKDRCDGILSYEMLQKILDCDEYRGKERFIIDMMRKFELCFHLDERADYSEFLIPHLLPETEPEYQWSNRPDDLVFRYEYEFLPRSIFPRFIVKTHDLSVDAPRWSKGVILSENQNKALIKADLKENSVTIRIQGKNLTKRDFLQKIIRNFEAIHKTIKSIKVKEKIPVPRYPNVYVSCKELSAREAKGLKTYEVYIEEHDKLVEIDIPKVLGRYIDIKGHGTQADIALLARLCVDNCLEKSLAKTCLRKIDVTPAFVTDSRNLLEYYTNLITYLQPRGKLEQWLSQLAKEELLFAQTWLAVKIGIDKDESKESKQSSKFDLNALASELADLKQAMMSRAKGSSDFQSMAAISLAEEAAIKGDREGLLRQLSDAGKFALECAKSAGKNLVVTAMQLS